MRRDRFSPLEFALVVGLAFGGAILYSINALVTGGTVLGASSRGSFGDLHIYSVVVYELIAAPMAAGVLYAGGWRPRDFPLGISGPATVMGILIFAAMCIADWVMTAAMQLIFPAVNSLFEQWSQYQPAEAPSFAAILLLVLVNPAFEEVFVAGYVIEALRQRFGANTAANVSVVIRASYHLYQGVAWLPFHCAYGLVQAYVYVRFGRLWPLIVSHAALDLVAFAYYLA